MEDIGHCVQFCGGTYFMRSIIVDYNIYLLNEDSGQKKISNTRITTAEVSNKTDICTNILR
jgi:hypothetical protein